MDQNAIGAGIAAMVIMLIGGFMIARPQQTKQILFKGQATDYNRRRVETLSPLGIRLVGVLFFCVGGSLGLLAAGLINPWYG